jgi:hypothetical protein
MLRQIWDNARTTCSWVSSFRKIVRSKERPWPRLVLYVESAIISPWLRGSRMLDRPRGVVFWLRRVLILMPWPRAIRWAAALVVTGLFTHFFGALP